jgi:hypothetical protein
VMNALCHSRRSSALPSWLRSARLIGLSLLDECQGYCGRALAALRNEDRGSVMEMILQQGCRTRRCSQGVTAAKFARLSNAALLSQ